MKLMMAAIAATLGLSSMAHAAPPGVNLVCLFTQANYQGAHFCFRPGQLPPNLDAFPLNDGSRSNGHFGSILVDGNATATVYDSTNYRSEYGKPMNVTKSIPALESVWKTTIFSMKVK